MNKFCQISPVLCNYIVNKQSLPGLEMWQLPQNEKPGLPSNVSEKELCEKHEVHPQQDGLQTGGRELAEQMASITAWNHKVGDHQDSS